MFVFKAAVVGAGTMGGQIAQTIAAAGIPVVLKDIDDALVQAGLEEAGNVTRGQIDKLVERGKITSDAAEAQIEEVLGRIRGTTTYDGFGDPGFVVNRILNSGSSEIWREQEQKGLSIKKIDEGVGAAGVIPVGPYYLVNLLGLDTVLHVAEHLVESYGEERFYVPKGMQKLVANGKLGAKTGGDGPFPPPGPPHHPPHAQAG